MSAVGFTGTQRGCTTLQLATLRATMMHVRAHGATSFHHGDCIGADEQAHAIALEVGFARITIHVPDDDSKRAFCTGVNVERRQRRSYMDRNENIARECTVLIACPGEMTERLRSGTWSTIRRARRLLRSIVFCFPNGGRFVERRPA
jgi:hypothetical protein